VCKAKKGDTIITQGQPGDWFYVVSSGSYDVVIDGTTVLSYTMEDEGDAHPSFGELAWLGVGVGVGVGLVTLALALTLTLTLTLALTLTLTLTRRAGASLLQAAYRIDHMRDGRQAVAVTPHHLQGRGDALVCSAAHQDVTRRRGAQPSP
jgi:hypothetical protein